MRYLTAKQTHTHKYKTIIGFKALSNQDHHVYARDSSWALYSDSRQYNDSAFKAGNNETCM